MSKYFVAAQFPVDVVDALMALRPDPGPGIRRVNADQIHVTLHYLGDVDPERVATALSAVDATAFTLGLAGVGSFASADGALTLWAGIEPNDGLIALHQAIAQALRPLGFVPEARAYKPHVTLARLAASAAIDGFYGRGRTFSATAPIEAYALFRSTFVDGAPTYACVATWPLHGPPNAG